MAMQKTWQTFIDLVTVVWLSVFGASLAGFASGWIKAVSLAIAGVFVVDLVVIFRQSAGVRDFLRRAWLDLLLLIPFFRIFRVGRIARAFRLKRLARMIRRKKSLSRVLRADTMERGLEGLDLFQKLFERSGRLRVLLRR
jgi:voltage-gated potassium channel